MGLPWVDKERLYSFFDSYESAVVGGIRRPKSFAETGAPPATQRATGIWSDAKQAVEKKRFFDGEIPDDDILDHITTCFTNGVRSTKNLSRLRAPEIASDLPYLHEDELTYAFFGFWLELPVNEWLDAFLFEVAASWQKIIQSKDNNEMLLNASFNLSVLDRPSSLDRLQRVLDRDFLDEEESKELGEKIEAYKETANRLNELSIGMRGMIESKKTPELFHTDEVEMTSEFFENQFLMRRVKENRKNIGRVRHALKDLGLE